MHWLTSFLLLYKALIFLGFFAAFISFVSSCSPDNKDKNPISISLSSSSNWRVNINQRLAQPGTDIVGFNSGFKPDYNEIFLLTQPIPGVYEFRAYEQFYETAVIEIPIETLNIGAGFKINNITNGDNQRYSIDCNACNINTNSENWAQYHTSCLIKNVKSGFCMHGVDSIYNISQADCATASRWDLYGIKIPASLTTSPDSPGSNCPVCPVSNSDGSTSTKTKTSAIHLSMSELVGIVSGSIIGTTIIALVIGYCCLHNKYKEYNQNNRNDQNKGNDQFERNDQYEEHDRVNVQIYDDIK